MDVKEIADVRDLCADVGGEIETESAILLFGELFGIESSSSSGGMVLVLLGRTIIRSIIL